MNYVCIDCGREFNEPKVVSENVGDFWGAPAYETFYYCPFCGGDVVDSDKEDEEKEYERWERERW